MNRVLCSLRGKEFGSSQVIFGVSLRRSCMTCSISAARSASDDCNVSVPRSMASLSGGTTRGGGSSSRMRNSPLTLGMKLEITPSMAGQFGFRPGDPKKRGSGLVSGANGADPSQPRIELKVPEPKVQSWLFEDVSTKVGLGPEGIGSDVKGDTLTVADVNNDGRPDFLYGAGTGLLYVGMNGFAFDEMPDEEVATSASLFYLLRQLGGSVGVALCALALDRLGDAGLPATFAALAIAAPLALLPMAWAKREQRLAAPEADAA